MERLNYHFFRAVEADFYFSRFFFCVRGEGLVWAAPHVHKKFQNLDLSQGFKSKKNTWFFWLLHADLDQCLMKIDFLISYGLCFLKMYSNSWNMTDRVNSLNVCAKRKRKTSVLFSFFNGISFYMFLSVIDWIIFSMCMKSSIIVLSNFLLLNYLSFIIYIVTLLLVCVVCIKYFL